MQLLSSLLLMASGFQVQSPPTNSNWYYPPCSIGRPEDVGKRVHTNWVQWIGSLPFSGPGASSGPSVNLLPGPAGGFTPTDLRNAYGDVGQGSGIVAIVDAYDNPNAMSDFNTYSTYYGLPVETSSVPTASTNKVFQVVYAAGTEPTQDSGWGFEMSLDVDMAHAMAPGAKIILVEAAGNDWDSMLAAVDAAVAAGAKQVSMSWLGGEFSGEQAYDSHFKAPGVTYFGASGDEGATVGYPSASQRVISCGGTSLFLDSNGNYSSERGWGGSGGGPSAEVTLPGFQWLLTAYDPNDHIIPVMSRGTPDVSAVADPATPVSVYDSFGYGGWNTAGGTSVATPILAGLMNSGGGARHLLEFYYIYEHRVHFHDITVWSNGYQAGPGYDFVTGVGSPISAAAF